VRRAARESLACFVRLMWPILNPGVPLVWGRHMDAMCMHLEGLSHRTIHRAVFSVPPGHSKSTLVSQLWGPWGWLHYPHRRWVFVGNSLDNVKKDSEFRRQILESAEYAALLPPWVARKGMRRILKFQNNKNGSFRALSTGSRVTGDHFDTVVMDDPHDARAVSGPELLEVVNWKRSVLSTRVRDDACWLTNMQRLGEGDMAEHMAPTADAHICLPSQYDPKCDPGVTPLGWRDWRTVEGQELYPERLGDAWRSEKRRDLGKVAYSAQIQMNPIAGEGNLFDRGWWGEHTELPSTVVSWLACVDVASSTDETADQTAMQVWALGGDGVAYLAEARAGRWDMPEKLRQAGDMLRGWPLCRRMLVERRGDGFGFIDMGRSRLRGIRLIPVKSQEPKESRIRGVSPHVEGGQVSLSVGAPSTAAIIEEAARFPRGKHDDQIDCMAYVLREWSAKLQRGHGGEILTAPAAPRPKPPKRQKSGKNRSWGMTSR